MPHVEGEWGIDNRAEPTEAGNRLNICTLKGISGTGTLTAQLEGFAMVCPMGFFNWYFPPAQDPLFMKDFFEIVPIFQNTVFQKRVFLL